MRTLIAISPERNAAMQGTHKEVSGGSVACINVSSQAPKIVGKPRRSEKNIASVFFNFKYNAVLKVIPDLDTPGNNARAWANPIVKDSFKERSNILLSPSSNLSAKYKTPAIKI